MRRNDSTEKRVGRTSENDRYLSAIFMLKQRSDALVLCDKKSPFSDTELRLLGEIILAEREGKRLISTQIADRLGITRSAVSQIVNRMEENGVVKRVPDAVDRKIAYVVMTEETMQAYAAELKVLKTFIGKTVKEYGVEKFYTLCEMMNEFLTVVEKEKEQSSCKSCKK
ncbi:MAG: MarR family transcriptional regulator [Clostridiales bacterium]|nr:MarR family transcriptional regulator [Clostridiales bacterium]